MTEEVEGKSVLAATRPIGTGVFTEPVEISREGGPKTGAAIANGPDGSSAAVWLDLERAVVESASNQTASDAFSPPVEVAPLDSGAERAGKRGGPDVVVLPDSSATVVWSDFDGSAWVVRSATRKGGGERFSDATTVSGGQGDATYPRLSCGPSGLVSAVWERTEPGGIVEAIEVAPIDPFFSDSPAPSQIWAATGAIQFGAQPLSGADGLVTIVWDHRDDARDASTILGSSGRIDSDQPWREVEISERNGDPAFFPHAAIGPDGVIAVVWVATCLFLAFKEADPHLFSGPVELSRGSSQNPRVALGPGNSLAVVWEQSEPVGGATSIEAITGRSLDELASAEPTRLSGPSIGAGSPRVTIGANAEAVFTWLEDGSILSATTAVGSGTFSEPVDISGPGRATGPAELATGPGGTTAVWISDQSPSSPD